VVVVVVVAVAVVVASSSLKKAFHKAPGVHPLLAGVSVYV